MHCAGGQGNGGRGVEIASVVPAESLDTLQCPQYHHGINKDPFLALRHCFLLWCAPSSHF